MALHEDHLGAAAQGRQSLDRRGDVAGFVAGRDHNADTGLALPLLRRPGHQPVGEPQLFEPRQLAEPAVGQGGEQGNRARQQAAVAALEHLPAGQIQQVGYVPGGEPALRRLGLALPQDFGGLEQRLPQPIVKTHHQPRARMTKGLQPFQHPLHVLQGVEGVGEQDYIERLALIDRGRADRFGVGADDAQLRMALTGDFCHLWIQLHTHPMAGMHAGQQIPEPTADLQHP